MRRLVIAILVIVVSAGVGTFWWYWTNNDAVPQNVRFSTVDDWKLFYETKQSKETGWIHIPLASEKDHFKSSEDSFSKGWVKPDVCGECHNEIWRRFQSTAHFLTSSEPSRETVLGPIGEQSFVMKTRDPRLAFELSRHDGRFLQTVNFRDGKAKFAHSEAIDMVTGSGNHGQTYLFWKGDALYQLPISYFTESDSWVNSPGLYTDGTADFGRPIGDRCLDCHLTYIAAMPDSFHRYDRSSAILGVTCVRCHGSGWAHVQYHRTHPESDARYITNPTRLERDRTNEVCAQCHSGVGRLQRPAFSYQPGEPLATYLHLEHSDQDVTNDDPHAANQLARLRRSRCYEQSDSMTCVTCHDPHQHERGDTKLFSSRCLQCHETKSCGMHQELGERIQDSCIKCHMAAKRDATGRMETREGELLPKLRDHYIRIWPELSKSISESLRSKPN
jgi:hypothetical protein